VGSRQGKAGKITAGEQFRFSVVSAIPYRADGVNDVGGGEPIALGEPGIAGFATAKEAALVEELGAGGAMDCPVHPAAAEQGAIGGVDDGIDGQGCDVGAENSDFLDHRFCAWVPWGDLDSKSVPRLWGRFAGRTRQPVISGLPG
jgi:hypothetical protein